MCSPDRPRVSSVRGPTVRVSRNDLATRIDASSSRRAPIPRLATRASPRANTLPASPFSSHDSGKIPANASFGALSDFSGVSADSVDDRSADEVTAAKEAVLEAEHAPFVQAILDGSLPTSVVVASMGDAAEEVRDAALSVARAAVSGDAASGKSADLLAALASAVDSEAGGAPGTRGSDLARGAVVALYGHLAATSLPAGDAAREEALRRVLSALGSLGEDGCFVASRSAALLVDAMSEAELLSMVESCKARALAAAGDVSARRAAAASVAGLLKGLGGDSANATGVTAAATAALTNKKDADARAGALALYAHCCLTAGRQFEPSAVTLAPVVFTMRGDANADVRHGAEIAIAAVVKALPVTAMKLLAPALVAALEHKAWQSKVGALGVCGDLATRVPGYFMRTLPEIFPAFLETVFDTHPKVTAVAEAVMAPICRCVKNAEILGMLPLVIRAIRSPQTETEECLDRLMETTFVNSMDAPSLAVILPVIMRGLRERAMDIKKKAAVTCGNICALVDDVRDLTPFIPALQPELVKCEEHTHPDLRECATKAKASLLKGLGGVGGAPAAAKKSGADFVGAALARFAGAGAALQNADPLTISYAAALGGWVIEMAPLRMPPSILANDVKLELQALLAAPKSSDTGAREAWDEALVAAAQSAVLEYKGLDESALVSDEQKDYIVDLQGIILAFAGRVLLQRTNFSLERGKVYGIVGQNGTGKTTLLNRVAAKDIAGFPSDVSVYYIQHEILSEKQETIVDFMVANVPDGVTRETVINTLKEVGFDDVKMAATIQSLSGGWRMKLAIARAMLWDAQVLLLDEPTNHLDTAAIAWLSAYLKSLTKTTICLVSHDYDFLADVLTDVIHLHDKNLTYYPMGFRDFQSLKPEIVAALPSPDNAIGKVASVGGGLNETGGSSASLADGDRAADGAAETGASDARKFAIASIGENQPAHIKPIRFPDPGPLEGVKNRSKCIMYMKDVSFTYPGTTKQILTAANVKITQDSRAALIGLNGAGKTTLMKLLIGELSPDAGVGDVWQHHNLRLAYIAQHSMHHLEESINNTPLEYLQNRFYLGRDKEIAKRSSHNLSKEELAQSQERGAICEIIGRQERGKTLFYECRRAGRKENDTDWEPITSLQKKDEFVMKMVRNFDEKLKAMHSGMDLRPLTKEEVRLHLAEFGIDEDLAMGKIKRMSGGQKSRLVLAAAMWINPHIIALDEPTNYLDNDTLAALTKALSDFKGGVLTISHNKAFVNELCNETWLVGDGVVVAQAIAGKEKKLSVAERRALKKGGGDDFSLTEAKDNKKLTSAERKAAKAAAIAAKGPIKDAYHVRKH